MRLAGAQAFHWPGDPARRNHKAVAIIYLWEAVASEVLRIVGPAVDGFAETSEHPARFAPKRITQMWLSKALYKVSAGTKLGLPTT